MSRTTTVKREQETQATKIVQQNIEKTLASLMNLKFCCAIC